MVAQDLGQKLCLAGTAGGFDGRDRILRAVDGFNLSRAGLENRCPIQKKRNIVMMRMIKLVINDSKSFMGPDLECGKFDLI